MRISDWSSDVCSSDLMRRHRVGLAAASVALVALLGGLAMSLYGLQQARAQRMIAEQRSAELEKVAAFQQSMLEGIDIEAMGIGMAEGLRGKAAKAQTDADRKSKRQNSSIQYANRMTSGTSKHENK